MLAWMEPGAYDGTITVKSTRYLLTDVISGYEPSEVLELQLISSLDSFL